jgi:hypothetical protein
MEPWRFDDHETPTNTEPFVSTCLVQNATQLAIIADSANASEHYTLTSYLRLTDHRVVPKIYPRLHITATHTTQHLRSRLEEMKQKNGQRAGNLR